jgi:hypothetical protein
MHITEYAVFDNTRILAEPTGAWNHPPTPDHPELTGVRNG